MAEPRYEFRVWEPPREASDRLSQMGPATEVEMEEDFYLVGPNTEVNAKISEGSIDVKRLRATSDGFQLWDADWSVEPPYRPADIERLLSDVGVEAPAPDEPIGPEGLARLAREVDGLEAARVEKTRTHFDLGDAKAESSVVEIGNTGPRPCLVIESTDLDRLIGLREALGLEGSENIPVNVAVQRALAEEG